jgi:hypothetical protein
MKPALPPKLSIYDEFLAIREKHAPVDDDRFDLQFQIEKNASANASPRSKAWARPNSFAKAE